MSGTVPANRYRYQYVPPSTVLAVLGLNAGVGDYLHRLIVNVIAPATGDVTLTDGLTIMKIVDGAGALPRGPFSIDMGIASQNGPFRLTTGAGASVIAVGQTVG